MRAIKIFVLGIVLGLLYKWVMDRSSTDIEIRTIQTQDPLDLEADPSTLLDTKEQLMAEVKPARPKTKKEILEVL